MAQRVGADVFGDAGQQGVAGDQALHTADGQPQIVARQIGLFTATIAYKQGSGIVGAPGDVLLNPACRLRADKYRAVFLALAADHKFPALKVDVVAVQPDQLTYPQTRTKK